MDIVIASELLHIIMWIIHLSGEADLVDGVGGKPVARLETFTVIEVVSQTCDNK